MTTGRAIVAVVSASVLALIVHLAWNRDYFRWPKSAEGRIDAMSDILRKLKGPASWCYPATSANGNLAIERRSPPGSDDCFAKLAPTSGYIEQYPQEYMKRSFGAEVDGLVCEVTLSTVWNDDRIVGSDCYYGIFREGEFPGIGATDEPFG